MSVDLAIVGTGARAPCGLNALQVAFAARARQLEPRDSAFVDSRGTPVANARLRALPDDLIGPDRLAALAAPALREARGGVRQPLPVVIVLPEGERGGSDAQLLGALSLDPARAIVVRASHAGFAVALERARELLERGSPAVLVGGVDSYHHPRALTWLEERGWLCTERDDAGRIPGEAAAFLRLAVRPARATSARLASFEHGIADPERMAKLLVRLAATGRARRINWLLSDINGEPKRSDDWARTFVRARETLSDAVHDDPIQHLGDVGAATGALLAVIACHLAAAGAVQHGGVILALHDDVVGPTSTCGAVTIDLPEPNEHFRASIDRPIDRDATAWRPRLRPSNAERNQLVHQARSCLEDIGSMGLLLAPSPIDEHFHPGPFAQRLLDNLDALAAICAPRRAAISLAPRDLAGLLDDYVAESPNRARRFAAAFVRERLRGS